MSSVTEFLANNRTQTQIAKKIGVDWLLYQSLDDLVAAVLGQHPTLTQFDCSVFDGNYVTDDIDDAYLAKLSQARSDAIKQRRDAEMVDDAAVIELHNHA